MGENKGAVAILQLTPQTLSISGNSISNGNVNQLICKGYFDSTYRPRTQNPKLDRYPVTYDRVTCWQGGAMVAKSLLATGEGYLNFSNNCGPDGTTCDTDYYCKAK